MITVQIESGICGFFTTVCVSKGEKRKVEVVIESTCEKVQQLGGEFKEMHMVDFLKNPINQNPVYVKAGECKLHTSCPVPCGLIKAAEVELGLALRRNVKIEFVNDK